MYLPSVLESDLFFAGKKVKNMNSLIPKISTECILGARNKVKWQKTQPRPWDTLPTPKLLMWPCSSPSMTLEVIPEGRDHVLFSSVIPHAWHMRGSKRYSLQMKEKKACVTKLLINFSALGRNFAAGPQP